MTDENTTDAVQANDEAEEDFEEIGHTCNPFDRLFHLMSLAVKSDAEILRTSPACDCGRSM